MSDIEQVVVKTKGDIKYITYYINRPIRQGDTQGYSKGTCINGVEKITEIVTYVYK